MGSRVHFSAIVSASDWQGSVPAKAMALIYFDFSIPMSPTDPQEWHSGPKVANRYSHLSSKTLHEAANAGSVIVPWGKAKAA